MTNICLFSNDTSISLIVKTAGNACNINCKYCFEKNKSVSNCNVSASLLEQLVNKVDHSCTIVFHGGEPLIVGVTHFESLLIIIEKYYPTKIKAVRIQTNGTLLNEEWIQLLFVKYKHLNIEIAISLDGTIEMNKLRVDYEENNTYDRIINAFTLLADYGIKAGMLSVISKDALRYAKEYIELIESISNVNFVKINALFNVENNMLSEDSISPLEYADFIIESSKYYIESKLYTRLPIEPFLSIIQKINDKPSRYCNYSQSKCYNYICLYPDGTLGPCDCLSVNQFSIINNTDTINEGIVKSLSTQSAHQLNSLINDCNKCDIREFCMCGCLSQRYYFKGNDKLEEEYCVAKHKLYEAFKEFNIERGN